MLTAEPQQSRAELSWHSSFVQESCSKPLLINEVHTPTSRGKTGDVKEAEEKYSIVARFGVMGCDGRIWFPFLEQNIGLRASESGS